MGKIFRIVLGSIAAIWLIAVFAFGAGVTYLGNDPEAAAAVAMGAASYSRDGSFSENIGNMQEGAATGAALARTAREMQDERRARRAIERMRDNYGDDWGDESLSGESSGDWGN